MEKKKSSILLVCRVTIHSTKKYVKSKVNWNSKIRNWLILKKKLHILDWLILVGRRAKIRLDFLALIWVIAKKKKKRKIYLMLYNIPQSISVASTFLMHFMNQQAKEHHSPLINRNKFIISLIKSIVHKKWNNLIEPSCPKRDVKYSSKDTTVDIFNTWSACSVCWGGWFCWLDQSIVYLKKVSKSKFYIFSSSYLVTFGLSAKMFLCSFSIMASSGGDSRNTSSVYSLLT